MHAGMDKDALRQMARSGGLARAEGMTKEERSEAASLASTARWGKDLPIAMCSGTLPVGDIPCFVLPGGHRLLSQSATIAALGMSRGSNPKLGRDRLANFAAGKLIKPFISEVLSTVIHSPVRFRQPGGGPVVIGYEAKVLPEFCKAVMALRRSGRIQQQQEDIARQCEILLGGLAEIGITALVDEATGYQEHRSRDALAKILEAYIAKELRPYVKTFQPEFYKQIFRHHGWKYPPDNSSAKPPVVGKITNDIVYERLAPGVLDELRRQTPRDEKGRLKHHLHRRLTEGIGQPKLREHLAAVTTAMDLSPDWPSFIRYLDRKFPRVNTNYELDLPAA